MGNVGVSVCFDPDRLVSDWSPAQWLIQSTGSGSGRPESVQTAGRAHLTRASLTTGVGVVGGVLLNFEPGFL